MSTPPIEPLAWQPEWKMKGIRLKDGDFTSFMWLRPNPAFHGDYHEALWYALTIDGYAYARARWGFETPNVSASEKYNEITSGGLERVSFEDLRFCLFLIQRGIKFAEGSGPCDDLEAEFFECYSSVCIAWNREWQQNEEKLPDLAKFGITALPEESIERECLQ
jgi:hypothetical protein